MPPPIDPVIPREMRARHRRERKALCVEHTGDITTLIEKTRQLWDRPQREREAARAAWTWNPSADRKRA